MISLLVDIIEKNKEPKSCQPKNTNYVNQSWPSYVNYELFKISQDYIIIFLETIRGKQITKINQTFSGNHKINESNIKVSTHY